MSSPTRTSAIWSRYGQSTNWARMTAASTRTVSFAAATPSAPRPGVAPAPARGWHRGRRGAGDRDRPQQVGNHRPTLGAAHAGGRVDDQAVGQRRLGQRLDVVRDDVVAADQGSPGAGGAEEGDAAARAG